MTNTVCIMLDNIDFISEFLQIKHGKTFENIEIFINIPWVDKCKIIAFPIKVLIQIQYLDKLQTQIRTFQSTPSAENFSIIWIIIYPSLKHQSQSLNSLHRSYFLKIIFKSFLLCPKNPVLLLTSLSNSSRSSIYLCNNLIFPLTSSFLL